MGNSTPTKKAQDKKLREDLESQISAMDKATTEKLDQSKQHLHDQLTVVAEKYRTVNGYMQARQTLEQVLFGDQPEALDATAREVADYMSGVASTLADKLVAADATTLDESFLDGLLDPDFIDRSQAYEDTAKQLLVVQLLQNIGPAIDDLVGFREHAANEMAAVQTELDNVKGTPLTALGGGKK